MLRSSSLLLTLLVLSGQARAADAIEATLPAVGRTFVYEGSNAKGGAPDRVAKTVTKVGATLEFKDVGGDKSFSQIETWDAKDPAFLYLGLASTRKGETSPGLRITHQVEADGAFPLQAGKSFEQKYAETITFAGAGPAGGPASRVDLKCTVGDEQKLHVQAGDYQVYPVRCAGAQVGDGGQIDLSHTYYYSPELGVNVRLETDNHPDVPNLKLPAVKFAFELVSVK